MGRLQNFDEVYSALYVDFDNIYTRLAEQDPALARTFATSPQRWMRWLEGHALRMMYGDGVRRRILKKCCYLNPHHYHEFRPFFIRSAFQVVDCPPLTRYGKTSADIHLVMDCMDVLAHVTRFDEVIILSGDADFTPLLLRIQEHARRSLVLSVGYTSPAYVAACSWRIREDWFISQALEDQRDDFSDAPEHQRLGDSRPQDRETRYEAREQRSDVRTPDRQGSSGYKFPYITYPRKMKISDCIKQIVTEAVSPVPLAVLSQKLRRDDEAAAEWITSGEVKELLRIVDISPLEYSAAGPGYIFDPTRHEPPQELGVREELRRLFPHLYDMAVKVHQLTDIPLLLPSAYARLLALLVEEVRSGGFSRTETAHKVEARCKAEKMGVTAAQISFVAEAVIRGGLTLTDTATAAEITQESMEEAFFQRAAELCRLSQMALDERDVSLLKSWLQNNA